MRKRLRALAPLLALLAGYLLLLYGSPTQGQLAVQSFESYLLEMAAIVPAVVLLMGLFEVWVPKDLIQRHLGQGSGPRGTVLAILMGTAPTGPLYAAFPIAGSLLRMGARVSNVVVFLGTWGAAKVPQLLVEAQFLGPSFAALCLVLTVASLIAIGLVLERLLAARGEVAAS